MGGQKRSSSEAGTVPSTEPKRSRIAVKDIDVTVTSNVLEQINTKEEYEKMREATANDPNHVAIMFLYATWSTPCKQVMPVYQALIDKLYNAQSSTSSSKTVESAKGEAVTDSTTTSTPENRNESNEPNNETTASTTTESEQIQSSPKKLTFTFYKVDKDVGPRPITASKAQLYILYRGGKRLCDVQIQGKGLEKKLASLDVL
ncbi:UNVERIFIED_CONTAM: hypothetical protein HDU68_012935 [Siphonaria sp. JEL0065]|nr:hypothetical protein HDU68_012935 [Siphonaria sp. JEL0065]